MNGCGSGFGPERIRSFKPPLAIRNYITSQNVSDDGQHKALILERRGTQQESGFLSGSTTPDTVLWEIEPKQREEGSSFTGRSSLRLKFRAAYVGSYGKGGRSRRDRKMFNEIMAPNFPTLLKITNP